MSRDEPNVDDGRKRNGREKNLCESVKEDISPKCIHTFVSVLHAMVEREALLTINNKHECNYLVR